MSIVDREDGRFIRTEQFLQFYSKNAVPKLSFQPDMDKKQFLEWKEKVTEKLENLMKFPLIAEQQPEPRCLWSKARDGYRLEKWEVYPEPGSVVPFLILVPDHASVKSRVPAVLCFSGSRGTKELLSGEDNQYVDYVDRFPFHNRMAKHFAEAGMMAVAVENPGVGELRNIDDPPHARGVFSVEMIMSGRNYVGLSVFQKLKILDFVSGLNYVDQDKIAVSGHSLGTEPGMVLALLDSRINSIIFNDFVCDNRIRSSVLKPPWPQTYWHCIPDLYEWFAFPDLMAALAPKPMIVTEGGVAADLHKIREAYRIWDADDLISVHYYPMYEKPERRKYDFQEIPQGVTQEQFFEYANVDASMHCFKEYLAVPWLKEIWKDKSED